MEIGTDEQLIDDLDDFNEEEVSDGTEPITEPNEEIKNEGDDFIDSLLRSRGIQDRTKINFTDDSGEIVEQNWDNLSTEEKLNILNTSEEDPSQELDESEITLINAIRESRLTPEEYLNNLQQQSVNNYIQNAQDIQRSYKIDEYSDDELFIFDLMSKASDITDQEAQEALEAAKSNEALFQKQVEAIRNQLKAQEDEAIQQAQFEQEEQERERFNQYSSQIADYIGEFDEFSGYDLNLSNEDRDDLYEFITGVDGAGNNHFAKALSDPETLVKAAWLTLNGQQMIEDITNYFQNEIKQVRKESYKKGMEDAKKGTQVAFTNKQLKDKDYTYDDLDNF